MKPWLDHLIIIEAVFDRRWRDETSSGVFDLVEKTLKKPVSRYLRQVKNTAGLYHQIVVLDTSGLVVGMTDPTAGYWRGNEPGWRKDIQNGSETLHVGEITFSESGFSWEIPIALPITDRETTRPIGTIGMKVNPVALM